MAYSSQGLEQALDSLGTSFIDGVTVKIADKYCVRYDLSEVENILRKPPPQILGGDNHYDISFEKKVLEDLESRRLTREKEEQDKRESIEKYEKEKAENLEKIRREEEEKALEDERIRLEEIEREKSAKEVEKLEEENRISEAAQLEQRRLEEAEWKTFEEERHANNKLNDFESNSSEDSSKNEDEDTSTNAEEFATPPQETVENIPTSVPDTINKIDVRGIQSEESRKKNIKINFEDFEALSDPFADLELKTINDLAELQSILTTNSNQNSGQQTSSITAPSTNGSSQANYQYGQQQFPSGGTVFSPYYTTQSTGFPAHFPVPSFPNTNTNIPYTSVAQPVYPGYTPYPAYRGYTPPSIPPTDPHKRPNTQSRSLSSDRRVEVSSSRSVSSDRRTERLKGGSEEESEGKDGEELKPSRSVGDLIGELQKEQKALEDQKRKSVTSPIPPRPSSRGSTGLENWVPYPQLDTGQSTANGVTKITEDFSCLSGLSEPETATCKQLHEMGFSLSRLAKGCRALGTDDQKLINFCLVVDRLVDEGFSESDSEHVAVLHNADEDVCRKHLRSFSQLAEIGFPSKDIHEALIAHSFDHQAALDQLLS